MYQKTAFSYKLRYGNLKIIFVSIFLMNSFALFKEIIKFASTTKQLSWDKEN